MSQQPHYPLLERIGLPDDLRKLPEDQLGRCATSSAISSSMW